MLGTRIGTRLIIKILILQRIQKQKKRSADIFERVDITTTEYATTTSLQKNTTKKPRSDTWWMWVQKMYLFYDKVGEQKKD